jgi:prolyl-tRNA synthetase
MKKREAEVKEAAHVLCDELKAAGLRVKVDARDMRPGAKYYHWELRGVPLRIEIGPRDIDNGVVMTVTRGGTKEAISRENITTSIHDKLASVTAEIQSAARERVMNQIHMVSDRSMLAHAAKGGVGVLHWCGSKECSDKIEAESEAVLLGCELRGKLIDQTDGVCIICGKPGTTSLLGRSY